MSQATYSHPETERESDIVNKIRQLYLIARDHKRARYDSWVRNYRLVNNKFGSQQGSQSWMPAPRDSEIYPGLSSLVAWMTDQDLDMSFVPAADPHGQLFAFVNALADDLGRVMFSTWMNENYDAQVKLMLWDAFMYGIGINKNSWDNNLDDGYGNAMMARTDPWAFYPDPNATSFDDCEYMCEVRRMSLDEIERRYGQSILVEATGGPIDQFDERPSLYDGSSRTPKANPGSIPGSGTWPNFGSSTIPVWGRTSTSGSQLYDPLPGYVVYEFWIKQNYEFTDDEDPFSVQDPERFGSRYVRPKWRCIVLCNGHILFDELAEDLWSHGQHPYERFCFDDIGEFYGISLVDHLAYPQIYINRLLTALQHNAELTGNPVWVEAASAGLNRVGYTNRPGQRFTLNGPQGMQNKPEWLTPPSMPQQVMELVQFWIDRIDNIMGLDAMQRGKAPSQRSAEGTMQAVQEAAFVRIRSAQSNLEVCLRKSISKLADLIIDNYTEPRTLAIIGPDGQQSSLALAARHFYAPTKKGGEPLKFQLVVRAGARGPTSRAARIDEGVRLYTLGAVDDQYILELHGTKKIPEILQRLYFKRQQGLIGGAAGPSSRQRAGRSK